VSSVVAVMDVRFAPKRPYSAAIASLRLHKRSTRLHRLMYKSAERRTPERTVSKVSCKFCGSESSRVGGRERPMNSSCTEMVACLRQTASSWEGVVSVVGTGRIGTLVGVLLPLEL
jgi:hypothetical protein